ncbi:MAG: PHP domain-containing protein [Clostridia bacterium]|nr:PHP domain-containing protein [Clostridia bacterium]
MFDKNEYRLTKDWHTHTIFSDGSGSIGDNVREAVNKGLDSIAITDHGYNHTLHGMKRDRLLQMRREIERLRKIYDIEILLGIETNLISKKGEIDLSLDECKQFDVINMGLHRAVKYSKFSEFFSLKIRNLLWNSSRHSSILTEMYVRAIERYPITTVVHLHEYKRVNVAPIADIAKQKGTFIELNAKRMFFDQQEIDYMKANGNKLIIGSDAHSPERVGEYSKIQEAIPRLNIPVENIVNLAKISEKI